MTYQEFKNKYNGKWVDYDGQYGCQCWDLGEVYFTECLGLPASVLAGCGLVSNMLYPPKREELDKYFDEVKTNEMLEGDVCIWEYGHIAIYDHWDGKSCWYFSQNPNPCEVMKITDKGLHAFRLKGSKPTPKYKYLNLSKSVDSWRRTMIIVEKEQILAAVMAPLTGAIPMAEVMGIRRAVIRG